MAFHMIPRRFSIIVFKTIAFTIRIGLILWHIDFTSVILPQKKFQFDKIILLQMGFTPTNLIQTIAMLNQSHESPLFAQINTMDFNKRY